MRALPIKKAMRMGYSFDKRKRRNQHRTAAANLRAEGGGICWSVARWHEFQARNVKRGGLKYLAA